MKENIFKIGKNEVVSIVGSGGKTSLMFWLANEFKQSKVLVTTTTKIYLPQKGQYDRLILGLENLEKLPQSQGICVVGKCLDESGKKIIGVDKHLLSTIKDQFDVTLIESDGAREKMLKGWKSDEPVILEETTKTIGVINFSQIGKEINEQNIHNCAIFKENFANSIDKTIQPRHIKNAIFNKKGLFKNSISDKILFINRVDDENCERLTLEFLNLFTVDELRKFKQIVYGSVANERFYMYIRGEF